MKKQINAAAEFIEKHKVGFNVACYGLTAAVIFAPKVNGAYLNYQQLKADAMVNAALTREVVDRLEATNSMLLDLLETVPEKKS